MFKSGQRRLAAPPVELSPAQRGVGFTEDLRTPVCGDVFAHEDRRLPSAERLRRRFLDDF